MQYFGFRLKALSNLSKTRLDEELLETVLLYNSMDAKYHRLLYFKQAEELKRQELTSVYREQLRRIPTMVLTQLKGIPVNQDIVEKFYDLYNDKLDDIEAEISAHADVKKFKTKFHKDFLPSSPKDVLALFNEVVPKKRAIESTGEPILKKLKHPVAKLILKQREYAKLLSTYVKPFREGDKDSELHPDGLLHPIFKCTVTRTWRTSAASPNAQNTAKHEHREVREQIKPEPGQKIVAFDYSGIQARNVAMESKDKKLVDAFWNDYDIHMDWAKRCVKLYPEWSAKGVRCDPSNKDSMKQFRQIAKNQFVFASFFGAGIAKISAGLEIPEDVGRELQGDFFREFRDVKRWHERLRRDYEQNGYVTGLSGFRRRAPIAPTQIINTPIQSDESIIVCNAMSRLSELGKDQFQPNIEIHDDLSYVWEEADIEKNSEVVIREMTRIVFPWMGIVPIGVEMLVGDDWASLKEVGKYTSVEIWRHKR
jgi:DNA polymerase-1